MIRKCFGLVSLLIVVTLVLVACGGASSGDSSQPAGVAQSPAQRACLVPDVVGLNSVAAEAKIVGSGLQMLTSKEFDSNVPGDVIISQNPPAGTRLEPCAGDVTLIVSLGPEPRPTDTPVPTDTPLPAETPIPVNTPIPDDVLFYDSFDDGIKPEWEATGTNFFATNGRLVIGKDGIFQSRLLGNSSWTNYRVHLTDFDRDGRGRFTVRLHVQDRNNYIAFNCDLGQHNKCYWARVVDGQENVIPATTAQISSRHDIEIVVDNGAYSYGDGDDPIRFTDNTFSGGGVLFDITWPDDRDGAKISFDSIQITVLTDI